MRGSFAEAIIRRTRGVKMATKWTPPPHQGLLLRLIEAMESILTTFIIVIVQSDDYFVK